MTTRLHIGCGTNAPKEWINIDCSWSARLSKHKVLRSSLQAAKILPRNLVDWPDNVLIHDVTKGLPFEADSVHVIYSSNMMEHLYLDDARRLLKECYRVLVHNGVLRVVVPDLAEIISDYCEGATECSTAKAETRADLVNARLVMYYASPPASLARRLYYAISNPFHKWMYDGESLSRYFTEAGFREVERRGLFDSRIDRIRDVERPDHFTERRDLCIEGIK